MNIVACSSCFVDRGLCLDAEQLGEASPQVCPNCGSVEGKKLDKDRLGALAYRFFVWGSFWKTDYGGAPLIQFNEHQKTSIALPLGFNLMWRYSRISWGLAFFTMVLDSG